MARLKGAASRLNSASGSGVVGAPPEIEEGRDMGYMASVSGECLEVLASNTYSAQRRAAVVLLRGSQVVSEDLRELLSQADKQRNLNMQSNA